MMSVPIKYFLSLFLILTTGLSSVYGQQITRDQLLKLFYQANTAVKENNYQAAVDAYTEIIKRSPGLPDPYLQLGNLYAGRTDDAAALKKACICYLTYIKLKPESSQVPLLENKADVSFGSRYLKQDTRRILYFWHTCMNKFLTLLTNMYTNLDITDMETCYKLFKKEVIKEIAPKLKENRFGFEPEVTIYVAKGNWRVYESAISYNPRTYEEGKKIKAKDGLRALYCIFHYGANTAPIPMQFILYLFIGAISAIANIISFMILTKIFNSLIINIAIAFIISALINYILCILILFRHKARWSSTFEIITYIITLIIMGTIDYYTTLGLLFIGLNNFWAKTISSGVGVIGNFLLRKYFVFPESSKK